MLKCNSILQIKGSAEARNLELAKFADSFIELPGLDFLSIEGDPIQVRSEVERWPEWRRRR
jgi:hypothetical protein